MWQDEVPDGPLDPPEESAPPRLCSKCDHWRKCPCECGNGWCVYFDEFTSDDPSDMCGVFDGELPGLSE